MRVAFHRSSCRRHRADRSLGVRAGGFHFRHRGRFDQRRAAGCLDHRDLAGHRSHSQRRQRRARRVPAARPGARPLQAAGRALGLRHHRRARRGTAGRAEPLGALRHAGGDADRDGHRHRRIAAGRHQLDPGGRQRRSPPDGGTAAAGPQLDGAGDAGQGHHRQRRGHQPRGARPRLPAQSRRPGDHPAGGRRRLRAAEVQPRGDRRVPGGHQPVRHHPGPLARHPGAGGVALGHQRA